MRILFYVFVVVPAAIILLLGGMIALSLQSVPLVEEAPRLDLRSADNAWRVLRRLVVTVTKSTDDVSLIVSKPEIDGLLALASRGIPHMSARAELGYGGAMAHATLALPRNPFGAYLNVKAGLLESEHGLVLTPVSFGKISLPGSLVDFLARFGLDILMGSGSGDAVLDAVERVTVDSDEVAVYLNHDPEMLARLKSWDERLIEVRDRVQPLGDPVTVRVYFSRLVDVARQSGGRVPLAKSLSAVFALARERSATNDPVVENQAAILALAGFHGEDSILRLIGPVVTDELRARLPRGGRTAVVNGREDLPKHFLISAALQIISTSSASYAVGELKELLDTGKGGSGFSFVDLAADRAGVRLAEVALSRASARRLQDTLAAGAVEATFFPPVAGLQEWMPQAAFEERFGSIDDNRYKAVVREIDDRIEKLPAYAG